MYVRLGLGGGPTTVNRISVTDLHRIMTPSFISLDIFSFVITYLFAVLFFHNNDGLIGHQLAAMMPFVPMSHHKRHDLS